MKLLVIDDQELVRFGAAAMLKQPVAEATSENALKAIAKTKPDVVLLGMNGQGFETLEAIRSKHSNLPVIALGTDDKYFASQALLAGASDFLPKSANRAGLSKVVRRAAADGHRQGVPHDRARFRHALSPREMEVVLLVAKGRRNREIAKDLGISIETVKEHVQKILRKLHVIDRTQAAVWAVRQGLA